MGLRHNSHLSSGDKPVFPQELKHCANLCADRILTLKMYMLWTGRGLLYPRLLSTDATFGEREKSRNTGSRSCMAECRERSCQIC